MISLNTYAAPPPPLNACCGNSFVTDNVARAKLRRQHKLSPYILDFYCPEANLAVECDGLPHFTTEGIEKDRVRTQWLNGQGVEVIRFTSNEIENDTQRILFEIDVVLKRLLKQDAPPHPPAPSPPREEKGRNKIAVI